jgi:hypothetical protein
MINGLCERVINNEGQMNQSKTNKKWNELIRKAFKEKIQFQIHKLKFNRERLKLSKSICHTATIESSYFRLLFT